MEFRDEREREQKKLKQNRERERAAPLGNKNRILQLLKI